MVKTLLVITPHLLAPQARAARVEVEAALDSAGWPWLPGISRWLDVLLVLEQGGRQ